MPSSRVGPRVVSQEKANHQVNLCRCVSSLAMMNTLCNYIVCSCKYILALQNLKPHRWEVDNEYKGVPRIGSGHEGSRLRGVCLQVWSQEGRNRVAQSI